VVVGVGAGVAVAAVVLGIVFMQMFRPAATPEQTGVNAAPGLTAESTVSEQPEPELSAGPEASATASSVVNADASASVAVKVKPPPPRPWKQRPPPPKKPTVDCSNPFTIDKNGKKRPRPECFR
jgi:hypothetical protein